MMTKPPIPNDLVGITVNDEPLTVAVEKLEHSEVAAVIKEELCEQRRCLPVSAFASIAAVALRARAKYYVPHSRAKHLTKDQIRKEYGVMSVPHASMLANVLDCLRLSERPLSNKEVAAATGYDLAKVMQVTSNVFRFKEQLSGLTVAEEPHTKEKQYHISAQDWPQLSHLIHFYNEARREHKKKIKQNSVCAQHEKIVEAAPNGFSKLAERFGQELEKVLGVSVTVNGRIEVVFKLEGMNQ